MIKKLPKAVIILHKFTSIYPRFYEIVAQNEYLEEVKKSFGKYLDTKYFGSVKLNATENETWSAISKDSAEKLEELFGGVWTPVGSQNVSGRQYIQPLLKHALEKGYEVYYHNSKELVKTNGTKDDIERTVDLFD